MRANMRRMPRYVESSTLIVAQEHHQKNKRPIEV